MQFAPFIDPEPSALVQRYSWEIETIPRTEPDTKEFSQLRADFIADRDRKSAERQDEIRRIEAHLFAARLGDEESLLKTQQQLFDSMKDFQKFVPGNSATAAPLTSWADVEKVVQDVQAQWDTKTNETHLGKVKNCLRKMCNGLNNHSTTLKLLPSESVYTSLIAGSVSMIIKASANHINITEAFAQGIVVINDAVSMVQRSQVYDTPALKQLAMRLYSHVLTYLTQFMAWFTHRSRTRFLKSFNENIQQNFQAGLDRVKEVAELLCRHIQLHMSADGRISKLMLEETSGNVKHLLHLQEAGQVQARIQTEATANLVENMVHSQFQKSREELREDMRSLANTLHEMLRQEISATGMTNLLVHQAALSRAPSPGGLERHGRSGSDISVSSSRTGECITTIDSLPQRGAVIQFESRHFEEFFDWDQVHLSDESPQPVLADPAFVTRLKSFTETMESRIMYAHSRYQGIESKSLIDAVGRYISLARETNVPVISYFCRLSSDEASPNRTKESMELSALLYGMIRQVINLLPAELDTDSPRFDGARLASLDGTLRTWDAAISVFKDLVQSVQLPLLLIVIDGLVLLEDDFEHSTDGKIDKLVCCLKQLVDASDAQGRIIKVLFTTDGLSEPLCRELDERDIVACSSFSPGRARRPARSGQIVSF